MRSFSLVSLLVTLVIVAFLWARSAQDSGLTSSSSQASDAEKAAAAFQLQQTALDAWRATNGTYAGVTLPASNGVKLVRADAASYCLQAGTGPNVEHLTGPGGNAPVDGPC